MKFIKLLIVAGTFILHGCADYTLIERNEIKPEAAPGRLKIICIDPRFYFADDEKNYQLKKTGSITEKLKNDILTLSVKNKIDLTLYDLSQNAGPAYYYDLLSLKQNMLAVNFNQRTPLNFNQRSGERNKTQMKIFVYPPRISYDFSGYSKNYGTPYFSYIGIYELKDETLLYHIVVNTDLAETIYREYKSVKGGLKKGLVGQMIYDSYASLGRELGNAH